ncbi:hypothetical protein Pla110_38270 [Polystyrenella longa]|uniref:DUF4332 domain-containing protein n=1 Tax=Polystyrenella longa TaxID=2528007 RepID=A0A518CS75_9PLAN|nr:DUF4332 domain-containing protein [Polystyrenella longa]QDU82072.1 hypothetical protein Pla110_38270 [Polystyrenella longa]
MSVLFRIVYASKCNGTHHKLAMDALRYLDLPESEQWTRLFLKHADSYIEGSKAPDKRFRDFRNHVLHVEDNFWGGAVKTASRWYDQTVEAIQQENWKEAVYSAGVLSHYYTDPIMPFHTAQSEEETQMHRAVEWSLSKSYDDLFALFEAEYQSEIIRPRSHAQRNELVQDLVLQGATQSNRHYQNTIDHYNLDYGVQDPPAGLDAVLRETYAKLLGYAAIGFARILEELFRDAAVKPPAVSLTLESVFSGLEIPIRWVTRKVADREERLKIEALYQEFVQTGRVQKHLPEDDRLVRQWHAEEVRGVSLSQLNQVALEPMGTAHGQGGDSEKTNFLHRVPRDLRTAYELSRGNRPGVVTTIEVVGPKPVYDNQTSVSPRPTFDRRPATPVATPSVSTPSITPTPKIVASSKPKIRVKSEQRPERQPIVSTPETVVPPVHTQTQKPVEEKWIPRRPVEPRPVELNRNDSRPVESKPEQTRPVASRLEVPQPWIQEPVKQEPVKQQHAVETRVEQEPLPLDPQTGIPSRPSRNQQESKRNTPQTMPIREERLKYYLHRSDNLVDAPSIGPKTAKRFQKMKIKTVDDFLNCDPEAVAERMQVRHITADEIRKWQDQAEFVCRIPNLRGHDAQILVGSGIHKVEHLEGWEPRTLLEFVEPFVESPEGVRLLRGSGQPDLAEVTDWLRWSNSARTLRAA